MHRNVVFVSILSVGLTEPQCNAVCIIAFFVPVIYIVRALQLTRNTFLYCYMHETRYTDAMEFKNVENRR